MLLPQEGLTNKQVGQSISRAAAAYEMGAACGEVDHQHNPHTEAQQATCGTTTTTTAKDSSKIK